MANTISSIKSGSTIGVFAIPYATCSTAADTVAKVATVVDSGNFVLETGAMVVVKFTNKNSASNPTLNINSTGAKPIYQYGTTVASTGTTTSGWVAGAVVLLVYDGTGWVREYWNNTTYSNMKAATADAAGSAGLVPAPGAGKQTSFLRGDGTWVVPTNTTYSAATTSAAGLMSAADKTKLDGIATGANKYTLPYRLQGAQASGTGSVNDPNNALETGFYYVSTSDTNRPPFSQSANKDYRILTTAYGSTWLQQIATDFRCNDIFYRRLENGTWKDWVKIPVIAKNSSLATSHTHTMLSNKYTSRPTTANIASSDDRKGSLEFFHATSAMTTGAPPFEGHILHMNWDNTGGWDAQLCVRNSTAGLAVRGSSNGTWGAWQEIAMKNHTHTNVGVVNLSGDVLALALSSCATGGLTPVITNSASTNLPSGSYGYSAGYVIRRVTDQATIVLFDYNTGDMATNTYINGAWKGWVKEATQDYVRDAISDIGSSTASGCVSEFDSGVISYAAGSTYYNSKDSKSKFYLVTAKHSSYGSHSWVIDFSYLKTSYQAFRVMVGGSQNSTYFNPVWICVQVKKDSSNRLVVGVPEDYSGVTLTQVCGFY